MMNLEKILEPICKFSHQKNSVTILTRHPNLDKYKLKHPFLSTKKRHVHLTTIYSIRAPEKFKVSSTWCKKVENNSKVDQCKN